MGTSYCYLNYFNAFIIGSLVYTKMISIFTAHGLLTAHEGQVHVICIDGTDPQKQAGFWQGDSNRILIKTANCLPGKTLPSDLVLRGSLRDVSHSPADTTYTFCILPAHVPARFHPQPFPTWFLLLLITCVVGQLTTCINCTAPHAGHVLCATHLHILCHF